MRSLTFGLFLAWSTSVVVSTGLMWWLGWETMRWIDLFFIAIVAGGVWLVGVVLLVVFWMIESSHPRAPLVYTLPEDREDEPPSD
jgi:hypothetical protein